MTVQHVDHRVALVKPQILTAVSLLSALALAACSAGNDATSSAPAATDSSTPASAQAPVIPGVDAPPVVVGEPLYGSTDYVELGQLSFAQGCDGALGDVVPRFAHGEIAGRYADTNGADPTPTECAFFDVQAEIGADATTIETLWIVAPADGFLVALGEPAGTDAADWIADPTNWTGSEYSNEAYSAVKGESSSVDDILGSVAGSYEGETTRPLSDFLDAADLAPQVNRGVITIPRPEVAVGTTYGDGMHGILGGWHVDGVADLGLEFNAVGGRIEAENSGYFGNGYDGVPMRLVVTCPGDVLESTGAIDGRRTWWFYRPELGATAETDIAFSCSSS